MPGERAVPRQAPTTTAAAAGLPSLLWSTRHSALLSPDLTHTPVSPTNPLPAQAVVLCVGLTLVLISAVVGTGSAAAGTGAAAVSPGDLVLLQGLLLQLWSPLQFLGW